MEKAKVSSIRISILSDVEFIYPLGTILIPFVRRHTLYWLPCIWRSTKVLDGPSTFPYETEFEIICSNKSMDFIKSELVDAAVRYLDFPNRIDASSQGYRGELL